MIKVRYILVSLLELSTRFSESKKLEYGFRVIYAGVASFFSFGIRGRSYSNFVASTVAFSEPETLNIGYLDPLN